VQPEIARFAHVCAYDRSGSGWSELGPYPHTAAQIALEFDTLLQRAGETPPFVLVGHSMGGRYVRVYALAHPGNVTGMVLVDANSEDDLLFINGDVKREPETATGQTVPAPKAGPPLRMEDIPAEPLAQIRRAAADAAAQPLGLPYTKLTSDAQAARLWALAQPKHYAANNSPFNGDEAAALLARRRASAQLLGDLPLVVVTRDEAITTGPRAAERESERQQHQAGLTALSSRGKQVVAPRSGHHVQIDAPAVVVDAIREVVSASQKP
jgi:pimeloyl-ACP methyl ester carboxylesterase